MSRSRSILVVTAAVGIIAVRGGLAPSTARAAPGALGSGGATDSSDEPAPSARYVPVSLSVELDELALSAERREVMRDVVRFQVGQAFTEQHGIEVVDPPDVPESAPIAVVRIEVRSLEPATLRYEIHLELQRGTKRTTFDPFECINCTEHGVARTIVAREGKLLPFLVVEDEAPSTDASREPVVPDGDPREDPPEPSSPRARKPLGPLGKAGIAGLSAGVGAAAVGAVLIGLGRDETHALVGRETRVTDRRPPGVGVLIGGGVFVAAGAALLIVDRIRARPSNAAVVPVVGPSTAGLSLRFRFQSWRAQ